MLTEEDIEQFRKLYKNRFSKEISKKEAQESGMRILMLIKAIYKPIKKNQNE